MNKILINLSSLILLTSISSCIGASSDYLHMQWMKQNVVFAKHPNYERRSSNDITSKYLKGFNANPSKPQGEAGCVLVAMGEWENDKVWGWGRHQSWEELNSPMITERGISLDSDQKDSSAYIAKRNVQNPKNPWATFIYIGPWQYVSRIDKEIRFVATQSSLYGGIGSFFESKTPENAKIPEMPEIKLARSPESNLDYCRVLWTKTYGYNAVADLKKNPWWPLFSRNYFVGTGKVIEAKE